MRAARDPFRPVTWRGTIEPTAETPAPIPPTGGPAPIPPTPARRAAPQAPTAPLTTEPDAAQPEAGPTAAQRGVRTPGDPSAEHVPVHELVSTPQQRKRRRRRARLRAGLVIVVLGSLVLLGRELTGPPSADAVAERIHEAVQQQAAAQSGDPTLRVGPLDCVQLEPGRGNCLADATSRWRPIDGMMIAVAYEPGPDGELSWSVRLP